MDDSVPSELHCSYICQPCNEQGNRKPATHWCMTCPDFICEQCHAIHMTLRSTRNHVILEIVDYKKIGNFFAKFDNRCKIHQGEVLNYFCFTHNTPCCCVCKDKVHNKDCNVQHEDELYVREENCQMLLQNADMVEKRLSEIDEKIKRNGNAFKSLHSQRELFEAELSAGRKKVYEFYAALEANARISFDKTFNTIQTTLNSEKENIDEQNRHFILQQETMKIIKNLNTTKLQNFLLGKYIQEEINEKTFPEPNIEFKPLNIIPTVKVDTTNHTIYFTNGFEFPINHGNSESIEENNGETGSSTVEDERINTSLTNENASGTNDTSKCSNTKKLLTNKSAFVAKQQTGSAISKSTLSTNMKQSYIKADVSNSMYQVFNRFYIERNNKNINIVSVSFMEPDLIVMSEISQKRVLCYRTNGFKEGEVRLQYEPGALTVNQSNKDVVVGVSKMLHFIDSAKLSIRDKTFLNDYINDVACADSYVFACLFHRGIVRLDLKGNVLHSIPFIKGGLHICVTTDEILYSVRMAYSTNELHSFNLVTRKKKIYPKKDMSDYNGIACDKHGNVYLCEYNSGVQMFNIKTKSFSTLISDVDETSSMSCSSDAKCFVVACKHGREIKFFKLKDE